MKENGGTGWRRRCNLSYIFFAPLVLAGLAGCIDLWSVTQPSQVVAGTGLEVEVFLFVGLDQDADGSTRFGAILLPTGFAVQSATWCDELPLEGNSLFAAQLTNDFPPPPGYYWWVGTTTYNEHDHDWCTARASLVAGATPGNFFLDYRAGYNQRYEDAILDVPLTVLADSDGDHLPDNWENTYSCMRPDTPDADLDYDHDQVSNREEYQLQLNPCSVDTDADGMDDFYEVSRSCLKPRQADGSADPDADTLGNLVEKNLSLNPCAADTDGDGMRDDYENVHACVDALTPDAALDPDEDSLSNLSEFTLLTNPCNPDTDGDFMPDYWESLYTSCGVNPTAGDSTLNADGDLYSNYEEYMRSSDPCLYDIEGERTIITIGSGSAMWMFPLATSFDDARTELIYLASELGGPLTITGLGLNVLLLPSHPLTNFTIRMKHTSEEFFLSSEFDGPNSGWRTVYQGTQTITSTGWFLINFQSAFFYNGTDNIIMDLSFNNADHFQSGYVAQTIQSWERALVAYSNSEHGDPLLWGPGNGPTPSAETSRPNIQLYISPDTDPDNDGLLTGFEFTVTHTNPLLWDTDGDGMGDGWEYSYNECNLDPLTGDSLDDPDADALPNLGEQNAGTSPCDPDSDDDSMTDAWEVAYASCGLNPRENDRWGDPDSDRLSNLTEFNASTNPCDPDTDHDGMDDYYEKTHSCLNPRANDAASHGDGDSLTNLTEKQLGTNPCNPDTDHDGLPDCYEVLISLTSPLLWDTDGDGLSDGEEVNGCGTNPHCCDTDQDGMSDFYEVSRSCLNPLVGDTLLDGDTDGLSNGFEHQTGLEPCLPDTDADGIPDGWEIAYNLNPFVDDSELDPDNDLLPNLAEFLAGTNPQDPDSDDDLLPDAYEVQNTCLHPLSPDAAADPDGDGLSTLSEYYLGTAPCQPDTDEDGMPDGFEAVYSLNPLEDDSAGDPDQDGLSNLEEYLAATDPQDPDTDDDGMSDGFEAEAPCLDPLEGDSSSDPDNDSLSSLVEFSWSTNPCRLDTDEDGLTDYLEILLAGTNPLSPDSDGDWLSDGAELGVAVAAGENMTLDTPAGGDDEVHDFALWVGPDLQAGSSALHDDVQVTMLSPPWPRNFLTSPLDPDSDLDGIDDYVEINWGANPLADIIPQPHLNLGPNRLYPGQQTGNPALAWTGSEYGLILPPAFTRLSAEGDTIGPAVMIHPHFYTDALVWTGSEFATAWYCPDAHKIKFQRLALDGATVGPAVVVSYLLVNDVQNPALVWSGSEFGVAWYRKTFEENREVYFSRLSASGTVGLNIRITYTPAASIKPALAWAGSGWGLVWTEGEDKLFQRLALDGSPAGPPVIISSGSPTQKASLTWTGSEFGVAWPGWNGEFSTYQIFFRRLSAGGIPLSPAVPVSAAGSSRLCQDLTLLWNGEKFAAAWTDMRTGHRNLYLQILLPTGKLAGENFPLTATNAPTWTAKLAWTGTEFGAVWTDMQTGISQLMFTRLSSDRDGDGLRDDIELRACSSPVNYDSDFDGLLDSQEDENLNGLLDPGETSPCAADSDSDGLSDHEELSFGTDPLEPDTDGDGLLDSVEILSLSTNPLHWDTDHDTMPDGFEFIHGLNPLNPADAAADPDADGNPNRHECYNGTDPAVRDPVCPAPWPSFCSSFWADADADGYVAPGDIAFLRSAMAGMAVDYYRLIPAAYDPLDLNKDGYPGPGDILLAIYMVGRIEYAPPYPSAPAALEIESAPSSSVAVGSTARVTLAVRSESGWVPFASGFPVLFWIDPGSEGNALLLGGDGSAPGEAGGNRYDISGRAAENAPASIVLLITRPGAIILRAKIPAGGTPPYGRWWPEIVLTPPIIINSP